MQKQCFAVYLGTRLQQLGRTYQCLLIVHSLIVSCDLISSFSESFWVAVMNRLILDAVSFCFQNITSFQRV